jgi:GNAT superfamily N-acetyltransferase
MFQIRQRRTEDFEKVLRLLRQLWPDKPLDEVALRTVYDRALVSESQVYLCACDDQNVVGFGSLTLKNNLWQQGYLGHIDELVVDGEYRGRGAGTQLLEQLIFVARQKGCRRVELDSAFHRTHAHEFYQQHGFQNRAFLFSREP